MSSWVLARGEVSPIVFKARILMPLALVLCIALLQRGNLPKGILATTCCVLLWGGLEIQAAVQRLRQMWVRDTGDGFDVIDRRREFHVSDSSITSLAVKTKRIYEGGELKSLFRQFIVWSDQETEPITLESTLKGQAADPLGQLTTRIWNRVLQQTNTELHAGRPLAGDGWRLDAKALTWGNDSQEQSVPLKEITACEERDDQICIWRLDQDDAVAKFPLAGRNVCLLSELLRTVDSSTSRKTEDDSTTLGRILFERRTNSMHRLLAYLGGGVLVIVGIALLLNREGLGQTFLIAGVPCVLWAFWTGFVVFQCRERGIHKAWALGRQQLRYVDIATFTYAATRQYKNGAYVGTRIGLHFKPVPGLRAPRINFCTTIINEDAEIEALRDFIAKAIAARMRSRLAAGETVTWTKNLAFAPEGILYRPAGVIGRKETQLLPYADYGGQSSDQGVFYLFRRGEEKFVMSEEVSALNFFPGFFLLSMLQRE